MRLGVLQPLHGDADLKDKNDSLSLIQFASLSSLRACAGQRGIGFAVEYTQVRNGGALAPQLGIENLILDVVSEGRRARSLRTLWIYVERGPFSFSIDILGLWETKSFHLRIIVYW